MNVRTNLTELMRLALARAEDPAFVEALQADPQATLTRTFGITFVPNSDELSDDDLDHVVGGVGLPGLLSAATSQQQDVLQAMSGLLKDLQSQRVGILVGSH